MNLQVYFLITIALYLWRITLQEDVTENGVTRTCVFSIVFFSLSHH